MSGHGYEIAQKLAEWPARAGPAAQTPPTVFAELREQGRVSRREALTRRNLQAFEDAAARIAT